MATYLFVIGIDETPQRLSQALDEARRAVDLAPSEAGPHAALALALAADDRLTAGLEEAQRAAGLDPRSAEARIAAGTILRLERRLDESLLACERAAALAPDDPRALTALGDTLREQERYAEALEIYGQAIDLDHEAMAPQLGSAATLVKAASTDRARNYYNLLLDHWDYGEARARLGAAALLVATQDYETALEQYNRIPLPDDHALPTLLALYGKGFCLLRTGRAAEAEYFLSTLIARVPNDYDGPARGREFLFRAYEDLADYFDGRGRRRRADEILGEACSRPRAPVRLARRLAARLASGGDADAAGAALESAILGSDPLEDPLEIADAALDLARLRTSGGGKRVPDGSRAARALALAGERVGASRTGAAHYHLARAQALARDASGALRSLQSARANGYLPADLAAAEPDFESLRRDPAFQALLAREPG